MVKIALKIKAYFENVDNLSACKDFSYFLKLKCTNCGEISDKWQDINEETKVATTKSETNYLAKCKLCSRENSLDIFDGSDDRYTAEDEGSFKAIIVFDCRGIEPVEFSPRDGWVAKVKSGKLFEDIDLSEGLWADYDQNSNETVEINEFEWQLVKIK